MTNLLEDASQWLSDEIDASLSSPVVFRRGSLSVPVNAGKARTTFDLTDSSGMLISVESRDFLISKALLVIDSVAVLPQVGDKIVETIEGEMHCFEVMNFGSEQPYRFCDPFKHKLRIHTKYVGLVTAI